jgi:hypothetical protein
VDDETTAARFFYPRPRRVRGLILFGVGIFAFGMQGTETEAIGQVTAQLYCERMELVVK